MATDLTIGSEIEPGYKTGLTCNYAQQCLWYETTRPSGTLCAHRNTFACQKHREEVFAPESALKTLKLASNQGL